MDNGHGQCTCALQQWDDLCSLFLFKPLSWTYGLPQLIQLQDLVYADVGKVLNTSCLHLCLWRGV